MEMTPTADKVAAVDLDTYLEALPTELVLEGKLMADKVQAFYFWLSKYHPNKGIINGVSIEELYVINVVDNGMEEKAFFKSFYDFPSPVDTSEETTNFYNFEFNQYLARQNQEKDAQYQQWAGTYGIQTTPGSVMKFFDKEGYEHRVRTDIKNRGQIIT